MNGKLRVTYSKWTAESDVLRFGDEREGKRGA